LLEEEAVLNFYRKDFEAPFDYSILPP